MAKVRRTQTEIEQDELERQINIAGQKALLKALDDPNPTTLRIWAERNGEKLKIALEANEALKAAASLVAEATVPRIDYDAAVAGRLAAEAELQQMKDGFDAALADERRTLKHGLASIEQREHNLKIRTEAATKKFEATGIKAVITTLQRMVQTGDRTIPDFFTCPCKHVSLWKTFWEDERAETWFLAWVGAHFPSALFELILRRLDRDAELDRRDEKKAGYAPIPHHRFGNAFRPLQNGPHYQGFLEQVRDRFFTQPGQSFWLRELFWSIASIDATALGVIDGPVDRGDAESIRIALQLIEGAPTEFALSQPDFAVQVIEKCGRVHAKLGELAESVFLGNSQTGSFNRSPGQPSPRYVSLKERSEALRDKFAAGSAGNRLFTRIGDAAAGMLTRERLDDEQFGFE